MAHTFRIVHAVSVLAGRGSAFAPIPVVAVIAHALGEVLQVFVRAVRDHAGLAAALHADECSLRTVCIACRARLRLALLELWDGFND